MDVYPEKRDKARKNHQSIVTIEDMKAGDSELSKMVNYSEDGLHFESNRLLQPGTEIFIKIDNPPDISSPNYYGYRAIIIWGRRQRKKLYNFRYGAKYIYEPIKPDSPNIDLKENRQHRRKAYNKSAFFRFQNRYYRGIIRDVSQAGCFIETKKIFNIGQILVLIIPVKKIDKNIMLGAEIMRLSPTGVGVKFRNLSVKKS